LRHKCKKIMFAGALIMAVGYRLGSLHVFFEHVL
jgi:hypothetical protein